MGLYLVLLLRLIKLAERQRSVFSRIYGYGVVSVLFTHFFINIGMTIGLVPVIGIPLPFFSYGGTSNLFFLIAIGFILAVSRTGQRRARTAAAKRRTAEGPAGSRRDNMDPSLEGCPRHLPRRAAEEISVKQNNITVPSAEKRAVLTGAKSL